MARNTKSSQPLTTAQRLSSIVKSCRDIMRKDKGLNGDLARLPMLIWIMFLKFLAIGAPKRFSLRLSPLPEQQQIVAELNTLQVQMDALKKRQAQTAAEFDTLLHSIIDKAFRGQL